MSLKNYADQVSEKNFSHKNEQENLKQKPIDIPDDFYEKNHKTAQSLYNEYKDYSKDELTNMLYEQVQKEKANGTFNFDKIENSINMILPYVSQSQRENLKNLLNRIK